MDALPTGFSEQFMSSSASNLIFVLAFGLILCLRKRMKTSHCKSCSFEADLELGTIRTHEHNKRKHGHKRQDSDSEESISIKVEEGTPGTKI